MKTVILSGGIGYRLKEETEFKPKPMIQIGSKPILWHIMKIYAHYGFNDFIIALGYKGDDIKDYFLNQRFFQYDFTLSTKSRQTRIHRATNILNEQDDFEITFANTGLETPTGERVRSIEQYIGNETFMLTYGDGLGNMDIDKIVKFHKQKKVIGTITGVHPHSRWGLVKKNKDDLVTLFRQKPVLNEYVNGGFMVFEPEVFKYIKPGEMIEKALERLAQKRQLAIYVHDGFWYAMDTYADLEMLNNLWKEQAPWKVWK